MQMAAVLDLAFDARVQERVHAYIIARTQARDGYMRFVFEFDRLWHVSAIEPPYQLVRRVEAVMPNDFIYKSAFILDS